MLDNTVGLIGLYVRDAVHARLGVGEIAQKILNFEESQGDFKLTMAVFRKSEHLPVLI